VEENRDDMEENDGVEVERNATPLDGGECKSGGSSQCPGTGLARIRGREL
jgi:hypothetical protein